VAITANLNEYNPKQLKLYCWEYIVTLKGVLVLNNLIF